MDEDRRCKVDYVKPMVCFAAEDAAEWPGPQGKNPTPGELGMVTGLGSLGAS